MEPQHRRAIGDEAEKRAVEWLRAQGFTIITRNWKFKNGEIDVICLDDETLVFVEVKFRSDPAQRPEDSISDQKQEHLAAAIHAYLDRHPMESRPIRVDVIAVTPNDLRHHRGIWEP